MALGQTIAENTAASPRIPTLDGWRAVAIGLVLWHHLMMGFYPSEALYYSSSVSQLGAFGVDIFFALSGLLITSLLIQERQRSGSVSIAGFYVRRAFRILPPCFVFLGAATAVVGLRSVWEAVASLLFFRNYLPQQLGSDVTGHLWSLAVEEHFYLIWPALFVWAGRKSGARAAAWLAIACVLWRVADAQNHISDPWLASVPTHFRTDLRLDALLWGCAAAFMLQAPKTRKQMHDKIPQWGFWILLVAIVTGSVIYSQLTAIWLAMFFPILLILTLLHPAWGISHLLEHRAARFIGRMSYSLYLWQQLFLAPGWEPTRWFQHLPVNIALTFLCAYASYHLIEKPCMRLGRAWSGRIAARRPSSGINLSPEVCSQ
ncbi:MAG: acyltransferase [Acidobacteriota bacterium]